MRRYRIDQACALPIPDLERAGVFDTGSDDRSWLCAWRSGATLVSSVRARWQVDSESSSLRLAFTAQQADGRRVHHEYPISVYSPTGPRGRGRTFLCPLLSDGRRCLRRCRVLYRPPNTEYFGCRQCQRLTPARRPGSRKALTELAAEVETAEQDLMHASSLTALTRAVERVAAARDAMATMLHADINENHEFESRMSAAEAIRHSPGPKMQKQLRCYVKLRRVQRETERDLRDLLDEPRALRFEVSPRSTSE